MLQELSIFPDNYVYFPFKRLYLKLPMSNINEASLTSLISLIISRINLYRDVYRILRLILLGLILILIILFGELCDLYGNGVSPTRIFES